MYVCTNTSRNSGDGDGADTNAGSQSVNQSINQNRLMASPPAVVVHCSTLQDVRNDTASKYRVHPSACSPTHPLASSWLPERERACFNWSTLDGIELLIGPSLYVLEI